MLTGVAGRTGLRSVRVSRGTRGTRRKRGTRARWPRRLAWAVALAVALAALFALALSQSLTSALSSDGASNILQAQAMLHGNPLLRGWWTSDVSFYTTELPEYALVVAARGLSPDVVHICGALTYTLTVALAGLLARGRATGGAGLRRAAIAVAIMLAPSILGGTEVFLENPDHFGTSAPVLLALLLLDWGEGRDEVTAPRWYVPVAVCAVLAWTQVGDELSLVAAAAPIAAVCALRLAVTLAGRRNRVGLRWDELRWDGLLAAAALISVAIAAVVERALRSSGGFDQRPVPGTRLASLGQLPGNARVLYQSILLLFGANNPGKPNRALTISQHVPLVLSADLHLIGVLAAGAGLVAGVAAGFLRPLGRPGRRDRPGRPGRAAGDLAERDRVNQVLVLAIAVTIAAGLFSTVLQSLTSAHEVAVLLPLAAVLAGRTLPAAARPLAERLVRARPASVANVVTTPAVVTAATVALAGWLAVGVAEAGYAATWQPSPVPVQQLAAWLVAHHQRVGLATYWQGTQTTVTSGGRVLVAPVTAAGIAAKHWEASSAWYQPSRHRATFVIAELDPAYAEDSLTIASARARFGQPAAEYRVGGDVIMIYRYNLLTRLRGRAFPGPS
jgi:hypothetical protein